MPDPVQDTASLVDYAKSLDCIHCGLCLQTCPTFRLTGVESSSPRGRIHLMRAVGEGRLEGNAAYAEELDFCLLCRHCESVCPAGVQFGSMMEFARGQEALEKHRTLGARLARRLGFRHVLPSRMVLRLLGSLLRAAQVTGLDRLAATLLGKRGQGLRDLPRIEPLSLRRLLPRRVPAQVDGPRGGTNHVALLEGCVMPEFYPRVNRSTARSLSKLGVTVEVPPSLVCCGSLHAHNGDPEGARLLAHRMIEAFEESRGEDGSPLPILVNSAGCGAHLRELHHLFTPDDPWHARAADLAGRVEDYTEFVARRLAETGTELEAPPLEGSVTWDDPCHLCHAQGVRQPPRDILAALSGLETVELEGSESCCGSAGIYSILRPDDSQAVFAGKLEALAKSGASNLVTANPGCQLQWEAGLRRAGRGERVLHLAELVDAALER